MLISRSRSRFGTIVSSRDPFYVAMWRKTDKGSDHLLEKANFDEFSNCIHIQVLYIKF